MSGIQNFFRAVLPASWVESMEKESREWMLKCNDCGSEKSVWEHGGIRWKAAGNPVRRMLCAGCGTLSAHTTYRKPAQ